jgi:hypothetical protein
MRARVAAASSAVLRACARRTEHRTFFLKALEPFEIGVDPRVVAGAQANRQRRCVGRCVARCVTPIARAERLYVLTLPLGQLVIFGVVIKLMTHPIYVMSIQPPDASSCRVIVPITPHHHESDGQQDHQANQKANH